MSNPTSPVFDLSRGNIGTTDIPIYFTTPTIGLEILWNYDGSDPTNGTVWTPGQTIAYNSWQIQNTSTSSAIIYVQAIMHDTVQDTYSSPVIQDFIFICANPIVIQTGSTTHISNSSPNSILYYYTGTISNFTSLAPSAIQISNPSILSLTSGNYVFFSTTSDGIIYNINIMQYALSSSTGSNIMGITQYVTGGITPTMGVTVTNPGSSSSQLLVTHGTPSAGTLISWDLDYRIVGGGSYTRWASGITAASVTVTGLTATTDYQFLPTPHVSIDGIGVTGTGITGTAPTSFQVYESSGAGAHHTLDTVSNLLTAHSQSGDTLTYYAEITNDTDQPQTQIALGIISGADVSGVMKAQVRLGGDSSNQGGTWVDISWGGQPTVRVTRATISWDLGVDNPSFGRYVESSLVTLPSALAPGDLAVYRVVCSTTVVGEVIPICDNIAPSAWPLLNNQYGRVGAGDAISGTVSTLVTHYGAPIGIGKVVWGRTATTQIKEVVFIGDSTTEMFPGGGGDRRGWLYFSNQMARAGSKNWRTTGLGISGNYAAAYVDRAKTLIPLCAATGRILAIQGLSWNDNGDYSVSLTEISDLQTLCTAAGVKMFVYLTAPPGSSNPAAADPWTSPLDPTRVTAYYSTKATLISTYTGRWLDLTPGIVTGDDYTKDSNNSTDDVHAQFGNSTNQLGQYRLAMNLYAGIDAVLAAL